MKNLKVYENNELYYIDEGSEYFDGANMQNLKNMEFDYLEEHSRGNESVLEAIDNVLGPVATWSRDRNSSTWQREG